MNQQLIKNPSLYYSTIVVYLHYITVLQFVLYSLLLSCYFSALISIIVDLSAVPVKIFYRLYLSGFSTGHICWDFRWVVSVAANLQYTWRVSFAVVSVENAWQWYHSRLFIGCTIKILWSYLVRSPLGSVSLLCIEFTFDSNLQSLYTVSPCYSTVYSTRIITKYRIHVWLEFTAPYTYRITYSLQYRIQHAWFTIDSDSFLWYIGRVFFGCIRLG